MSKNEHILQYVENLDNSCEFYSKSMQKISKEVSSVSEMPMKSEWDSVSDYLSFQCPTLKARTAQESDPESENILCYVYGTPPILTK